MARGMVILSRAKLIEMAKDMGINPYHLEKDYVLFRHIEDVEALWETHLNGVLLQACPSFYEAVDVVARKLKFLRK